MSAIESKLKELGIELPNAPKPLGNFAPYLIDNGMLYISGQISIDSNGNVIKGKLGDNLSIEQGQEAAKFCAIGILARAKAALNGDTDRIKKLIKLGAFVNATPDFSDHPSVINGASDLMVAALGKAGNHVRTAVGSSSLPANACVEIDAVFRVKEEID